MKYFIINFFFFFQNLEASSLQQTLHVIQQNIQARDDRMSWLDGCCLQVKAGKDKEVMTFHVQNPSVKKDWITGETLKTITTIIYPNNTRDVYLYIYWVSAYMG